MVVLAGEADLHLEEAGVVELEEPAGHIILAPRAELG
jgi:hypothetical protein